jgi:hypothetical protein
MATNSGPSSDLLLAEQALVEHVLRKADLRRQKVLALARTSSASSSSEPASDLMSSPPAANAAANTPPSEPMSLVDDLMLSLPQLTREQVEEMLKHT